MAQSDAAQVIQELREAVLGLLDTQRKALIELYNFERSFKKTVDTETPLETAQRIGLIGGSDGTK